MHNLELKYAIKAFSNECVEHYKTANAYKAQKINETSSPYNGDLNSSLGEELSLTSHPP